MITDRLRRIESTLAEGVGLVAVSKYHPVEMLREAYDAGQRVFGESRVQELRDKHACMPGDVEWHFIGHLQTNKVKYIAPYVSLIHAVDTFKLLEEISRQGERVGRVIPCLLQLHVACEETKFGFTPDECLSMLAEGAWRNLEWARIEGLMCMATNTDDEARIEREFGVALQTFETAKREFFADEPTFRHRSWGMSDDYTIAMRCGATLVRIGSSIFGARNY